MEMLRVSVENVLEGQEHERASLTDEEYWKIIEKWIKYL